MRRRNCISLMKFTDLFNYLFQIFNFHVYCAVQTKAPECIELYKPYPIHLIIIKVKSQFVS